MKMVKSLLLVSAAGLVAVSGAQAADLPVKAKPVEYVKVCSLYGAGFYYIPGTDICMKVGGFIRYQINAGAGANLSGGPFQNTNSAGFNNRTGVSDLAQRVRAVATFDTRQQTAYGTLRTYLLMGYNQDTTVTNPSTAPPLYATRAFIQIAGFTFGKATSFFDFVSSAAVSYNAGFTHSPDTGDGGQIVGSYTAQFGNGISGTIGIEQSKRQPTLFSATTNILSPGASNNLGGGVVSAAVTGTSLFSNGSLAGLPDIVGNVRIDQAWGSAQFSAAAHDVSGAYYGAFPSTEGAGHPDNKWGYAVSGGLRLNAPMFGPGDYFQAQAVYAEGATKYASNTPSGSGAANVYFSGNQFAFGLFEDAIFGGSAAVPGVFGNQIEKTTAWSVFASYEHFWTPSLRTSLYGSYVNLSHNTSATGLICTPLAAASLTAVAGCNPDFSIWNIGSRSQWNVTKDFYVGVDVIYQKFNTAKLNDGNPFFVSNTGTNVFATGGSSKGPGLYQTTDQDAVSVTWRVHRDIVP